MKLQTDIEMTDARRKHYVCSLAELKIALVNLKTSRLVIEERIGDMEFEISMLKIIVGE